MCSRIVINFAEAQTAGSVALRKFIDRKPKSETRNHGSGIRNHRTELGNHITEIIEL